MTDYWQPEDLTGTRPDVDEIAFGSPAMTQRWRGELRNAETQLKATELELERVAEAPDAYGPAYAGTLRSRAAAWRILIGDYRRYLGDELGPGPEAQPTDAALF